MPRRQPNEQSLRAEYQNILEELEKLREEAQFILKRALEHSRIKHHSITARVKSLDSILGKSQLKRIPDPMNKLTDLVGLRVVCLFLDDIERIVDLIRSCFNVVTLDNKVDTGDVSSFGYMSVHVIARMKDEFAGAPYFASVGRPFEIQVRTVAMEAWATISHYLDYKSELDIPAELKRDFHALSGTFYVADKHFQMFYTSSQKSKVRMEQLAQTNDSALSMQEVNADSLRAYLRNKFPQRRHLGPDAVSDLVEQLVAAGYKNIGQVDAAVEKGARAFAQLEKEDLEKGVIAQHPAVDESGGVSASPPEAAPGYADVGSVRVTIDLVDPRFFALATLHDGQPLDKETRDNWEKKRQKYQKFIAQ
jgi:GTP pyrophosphokinase